MRIHMVGIGGAGMSGIAEVLHKSGHQITGSDLKESSYTWRLEEMGVTVYIGHAAEQIGDAEQVVISTAIPSTNPELLEARRRSVPVVPRAAALARILSEGRSVAVAGTHGKTTTTSMTAHALTALGEDPTAIVGGELNDIGSNVVLSIFEKFVQTLPPDGHLITCADDPNCLRLAGLAPCLVTTYGLLSGDLRAEVLSPNCYTFFEDGEERGTVELGVVGRHNVLNSLAAAGVARWLGHDAYAAAVTLNDFSGVRRRFQLKGERGEIRIVDDYAHHPTELSATLEVARATRSENGRVIAVFQPHRYSRTRVLYREFGASFSSADAVLVTEVYGAGEMPQPGVNGKLIVDTICETRCHPEVYYIPQQAAIPTVLQNVSKSGDLVLTLGAGDISKAGEDLLAILEDRGSRP